ncbi:MAG TPA: sigma-54 dependent transcriptional regulator [Thermoanaerobaculia bacterium]|nr:sigma-54 dependent transcriptional regulator [Thermoanaerobaculia bacterium]
MPSPTDDLRRRLQIETRADSAPSAPAGVLLVPGLTILAHSEVQRVGERALLSELAFGREERIARGEPGFSSTARPFQAPLADPYLSRRPLRLVPGAAPGSVRLLQGESGTAVAVNGEPLTGERELSEGEIERGVVLLLTNRVVLLLSFLDPLGSGGVPSFGLVGESARMVHLRREIHRVAGLDIPVLLRGETGTGKELIARALHDASPRSSRPYLAVNMGAIPQTLAAAELFGAARGAYTGADRKRDGYFVRAQGGTLFLDEVGETPPEVQVLLLRALESHEIQPVGSDEPVSVYVRLLAATDADLEGEVKAGRFRAPLLHRLAGYEIRVPPLRDRRDDFGRLFYAFLKAELEELREGGRLHSLPEGRPFVPAALVARLAAYDWPGNVRQLRNVVRQLVIAGRDAGDAGMWLQVERLSDEPTRPISGESGPVAVPAAPKPSRKVYRNPEEVSEEELLAALRAHRWRLLPTAAALGISRTSLYDRIEKSQRIRKAADLSREEIEACRERVSGDLDAMAEALEVSKRGLQRRMTQLGIA